MLGDYVHEEIPPVTTYVHLIRCVSSASSVSGRDLFIRSVVQEICNRPSIWRRS